MNDHRVKGRIPNNITAQNNLDDSINDSRFLNESRDQLMRLPTHNTLNRKKMAIEGDDDVYRKPARRGRANSEELEQIIPSAPKKTIQVNFGPGSSQNPSYKFKDNYVSTTRYSILTWIPKSLLLQFRKFANIYFLIITVLTNFDFSPKNPITQIVTFSLVLFLTMLKEGFEDLQRYKQDGEVNNAPVWIYSYITTSFEEKRSRDILVGDLIRIERDQVFPADIFLLCSSNDSGIASVNTMNLDGETNLKEKICLRDTKDLTDIELVERSGVIECDAPNEYLESWESSVQLDGKMVPCSIKQLCLKGTILKNTNFVHGVAVYTGHSTKIMKNSKNPRVKMSGVLKLMNKILLSIFVLQAFIILTYSTISMKWQDQNGSTHTYLDTTNSIGFEDFASRYGTFLVAYSHLIPISLYVALEVFKLMLSYLMRWDDEMYYRPLDKRPNIKTSDLIEELGQVEIIFSDKTGTLTTNDMEFKKCSVNLQIFGNESDPSRAKQNYTINGESLAFEYLNDPNDYKNKQSLTDFFTLMAVCHTVIPDYDEKTRKLKYQGSSPDELALVEGAAKMGFEFVHRTSSTIQVQLFTGELQEWEVFVEFPFDSTRKRMSLLVKKRGTEEYTLMTKGADNIMLPRLIQDQNILPIIQRHIETFATDGLRTLVLAQKKLDEKTVATVLKRYENIKMSNDPQKETKLAKFYNSVEEDLSLVGCTGIEDKLQAGVPETISALMLAGIKIWVLTGDKQETAIEIAKSCKLIQAGMDTVILSSKSVAEFKQIVEKNINHFHVDLQGPIGGIDEGSQKLVHRLTIIIDGSTLNYALGSQGELRNKFFRLCLLANSVICCRVSPKQKADIVTLTKTYGTWITLAVGDGANDVPMIREAHIGVGIYGREGAQAARSADFAIGQFRYLKKLLLVHGRHSYRRISNFILYYFYKNVILVFTEIYFALYNGFSGQIYFADWLPMLYNTLWTSWPPLFAFLFDKDVNKELSYKYPKLYRAGPKQYYFNMETFWIWMAYAAWHGIICFFLPVFGLSGVNDDSGKVKSHWWISTVSFTLIMHIITYKLFLQTTFWNTYGIIVGLFGIFMYYCSIFLLSVNPIAKFVQPELNDIFLLIFSSIRAVVVIVLLPFVAICPDIVVQVLKRIIKPNPADKVLKLHLENKVRKKKNLAPQDR